MRSGNPQPTPLKVLFARAVLAVLIILGTLFWPQYWLMEKQIRDYQQLLAWEQNRFVELFGYARARGMLTVCTIGGKSAIYFVEQCNESGE